MCIAVNRASPRGGRGRESLDSVEYTSLEFAPGKGVRWSCAFWRAAAPLSLLTHNKVKILKNDETGNAIKNKLMEKWRGEEVSRGFWRSFANYVATIFAEWLLLLSL